MRLSFLQLLVVILVGLVLFVDIPEKVNSIKKFLSDYRK